MAAVSWSVTVYRSVMLRITPTWLPGNKEGEKNNKYMSQSGEKVRIAVSRRRQETVPEFPEDFLFHKLSGNNANMLTTLTAASSA